VADTPFRRITSSEFPITEGMKDALIGALYADTYILADRTKAFEHDFAQLIGTSFARGVSSGTAALHLGMLAMGIGAGDEVIMPANAYPPVADVIRLAGAHPVLVDVDPRTACLDPRLVEPALTGRTRAVVALHMYGHPVDLAPLLELARSHHFWVIEDCAHALGSRYQGQVTGSIGHLGMFSLGRKHITTGGTGGMVTTDNPEWANRIELLRNHGRDERQQRDLRAMDNVELLGYNYRMSELLAALGQVQLAYLPGWIEERRHNATCYRERLAALGLPLQLLEDQPWAYNSYLHFATFTPERDELAAYMRERGVRTGFAYPVPVHKQRLHEGHVTVPEAGLPISERLCAQVITVPVRNGLSGEDIDYVCQHLAEFFRGRMASA
jgi:perosamine synthetase